MKKTKKQRGLDKILNLLTEKDGKKDIALLVIWKMLKVKEKKSLSFDICLFLWTNISNCEKRIVWKDLKSKVKSADQSLTLWQSTSAGTPEAVEAWKIRCKILSQIKKKEFYQKDPLVCQVWKIFCQILSTPTKVFTILKIGIVIELNIKP